MTNNEDYPYPAAIECDPTEPAGSGDDMSEAVAARLVRILKRTKPTYVVNFAGTEACNVFVQDGKARLNPRAAEVPVCGKQKFSVETVDGY